MKTLNTSRLPLKVILLLITALTFSCQSFQKNEEEFATSDFLSGWQLVSSDSIKVTGAALSSPGYSLKKGLTVDLPATVMAALNRNQVYQDIFVGENLKKVNEAAFDVPWWYRKTFFINDVGELTNYQLRFEGLNYKANIWLNGKLIASADSIEGVFRMFEFNVTDKLLAGKNALAVEVIPPKKGDLTIGFVDWNPWPPDDNMGIWRPVKLIKTGPLAIRNLFVTTDLDTKTLDKADVQIATELVNYSGQETSGQLEVSFDQVSISLPVTLAPNEKRHVILSGNAYPQLKLVKPRIWWPVNMGDPNLYELTARVKWNDTVSDSTATRFGVRKIEDYFNNDGHRGYIINGKKTLIKGGGWVDDLFLDDSDEKLEAQIRYVKHMNLNTIRLEGFWGRDKRLYDLADENGILIMIGWSCQWEWTDYSGRPEEDDFLQIRTDKEIAEHTRAFQDQVEWLRNHPSVFLWVYGSDKLLVPKLETSLNNMLASIDGTRPILNSCGGKISEVTGKSGVKMNGPYSYVTPNYWYVDKTRGGAFGFNTETGPGIQPAPIESIRKMIPLENLWPIDSVWGYHLGRREFTTFKHWMTPFVERYGMENDVASFAHKAQMANYEAMRSMFEAFHVNRPNTTGIIQWMLNSAWPAMIWQLYDYYLMPNGAFYATRNACRPLNIAYNYADNGIYITNENATDIKGLSAEISVYDIAGRQVYKNTLPIGQVKSESSKLTRLISPKGVSTTYFLDLRLVDEKNTPMVINFYWLSTKEDVLDLENSEWYVTENKSYADLKGLNTMTSVEIISSHTIEAKGDTLIVETILKNPSQNIAFFIELGLKDKSTGQTVLPVFWDDNYISLLPGETRKVKGYVFRKDTTTEQLQFEYLGWNVK
ncbi:MAG: glycoside hydrolase family 2 [Cyclobacteriaceae bacterium]|nr:glycoside hydrolase family 2 [Cyclobacteriaceae bacterium]